jgi:ankyrin repeat protein
MCADALCQIVMQLLTLGADVNAATARSITPLHAACSKLDRYVCLSVACTPRCGFLTLRLLLCHLSSLSLSVSLTRHRAMVALLLERGADLSAADAEGNRAVHITAACGMPEPCRVPLSRSVLLRRQPLLQTKPMRPCCARC